MSIQSREYLLTQAYRSPGVPPPSFSSGQRRSPETCRRTPICEHRRVQVALLVVLLQERDDGAGRRGKLLFLFQCNNTLFEKLDWTDRLTEEKSIIYFIIIIILLLFIFLLFIYLFIYLYSFYIIMLSIDIRDIYPIQRFCDPAFFDLDP